MPLGGAVGGFVVWNLFGFSVTGSGLHGPKRQCSYGHSNDAHALMTDNREVVGFSYPRVSNNSLSPNLASFELTTHMGHFLFLFPFQLLHALTCNKLSIPFFCPHSSSNKFVILVK